MITVTCPFCNQKYEVCDYHLDLSENFDELIIRRICHCANCIKANNDKQGQEFTIKISLEDIRPIRNRALDD